MQQKKVRQSKYHELRCSSRREGCNGHYNCTPDLGECVRWWNTWDLAMYAILDPKVLDRNVTWLT